MSAHSKHTAPTGSHEESDVSARPVLFGGAVIVVLSLASFLIVKAVFHSYTTGEVALSPEANPLSSSYGRSTPPDPRLQTDPLGDLKRLRDSEDLTLGHYAWVDKSAGTVRLPINRAIDLIAARGLPSRRGTEGAR